MSSGRMVRVTRIDTGETWPSIAAAAKALFIAPTSLSRAKVSGRTHVCDIPLKFEDTMTSVNATEMKDLETGIVYPTIVSVADAFGVDTYQVYNNAKNGHRLHGHRVVFTDEEKAKECKPYIGRRKKRVRCVDTDEEFESVRDAAERMGVTSSCITNCIIQGWKVKGMMFEYAQ